MLRFFRNMTQSQIADELGISQMHVSSLLSRTLNDLRQVVKEQKIDDVVVALPRSAYERLNWAVSELHDLPVKVWIIPDYYSLALYRATVEDFAGISMLDLRAPALTDVLGRGCYFRVTAGSCAAGPPGAGASDAGEQVAACGLGDRGHAGVGACAGR